MKIRHITSKVPLLQLAPIFQGASHSEYEFYTKKSNAVLLEHIEKIDSALADAKLRQTQIILRDDSVFPSNGIVTAESQKPTWSQGFFSQRSLTAAVNSERPPAGKVTKVLSSSEAGSHSPSLNDRKIESKKNGSNGAHADTQKGELRKVVMEVYYMDGGRKKGLARSIIQKYCNDSVQVDGKEEKNLLELAKSMQHRNKGARGRG